MDEREKLLTRLDEARAKVKYLVDHLDGKADVYPPWKLKNLLDHFAGWDDAVIDALNAHVKGEPIPMSAARGIDYYNAETVSTRQTIPYERTLGEFQTTREMLKKIIREMPLEKYAEPLTYPWGGHGTVAQIIKIFYEHEEEHADEIRKSLNL
jgi:hypothetical protein